MVIESVEDAQAKMEKYSRRPNLGQAIGRFSRGLVKTAFSPFLDFPGFIKGFTEGENWGRACLGVISIPENVLDAVANTYYYGCDNRIEGESATEILLPAATTVGMGYWMGNMVWDAAQVSSLSELNTPGYIAAGGYILANALTSGYRVLNRG